MPKEGCRDGDLGCYVGEGLGNIAGSLGQSAMAPFVEGFYQGAIDTMKIIQTIWLNVPNPDIGSGALALLRGDLQYFVFIFGVIGFLCGIIRLIVSQDVRSNAISFGTQVLNMMLATGVYMVAVPLLLAAGDSTANWLLERSGNQGTPDLQKLYITETVMKVNIGAMFILYLLMFIAAIVNVIFLLFRNLMFLVMMAYLPIVAAASTTESGKHAWRRANGWLLALVLYKPVAAGIYALGFRLMDEGIAVDSADEGLGSLVSTLTGLMIVVLASLALPALVKFVVPAAGVGASAFSGGGVLAAGAGIAAGAAVIAATGGGAAAGGVAKGAATAGGGAASSTAASGGGSAGGAAAASGGSGGRSGGSGSSPLAGGSSGQGGASSSGSSGGGAATGSGSTGTGSSGTASGGDVSGKTSPSSTASGGGSSTAASGSAGSGGTAKGGGTPSRSTTGASSSLPKAPPISTAASGASAKSQGSGSGVTASGSPSGSSKNAASSKMRDMADRAWGIQAVAGGIQQADRAVDPEEGGSK